MPEPKYFRNPLGQLFRAQPTADGKYAFQKTMLGQWFPITRDVANSENLGCGIVRIEVTEEPIICDTLEEVMSIAGNMLIPTPPSWKLIVKTAIRRYFRKIGHSVNPLYAYRYDNICYDRRFQEVIKASRKKSLNAMDSIDQAAKMKADNSALTQEKKFVVACPLCKKIISTNTEKALVLEAHCHILCRHTEEERLKASDNGLLSLDESRKLYDSALWRIRNDLN